MVNRRTDILKTHLKPLLQIPIILFLALLHSVYVHAQTVQLDFDPNVFQIVVTPDSDLIGWYDANKYGQDFSIPNTNAPGVYACSAYCPQAALDAGAVYYKEFQVAGHGTVIVYYDANGNIVGTGRDLDGDGIGDSFDVDGDGDGVIDSEDQFPFDPNRWTDQIGDLGGEFQVSATGAATYTIPVAVPPGSGGVQPSIHLNYSSQAGNGLLGVGWSIGGLSSISRCGQTWAQDGQVKGITYTDQDRFCLDGQRLVLASGTYGQSNAEYRTELDGFSRITHTTTSSGPNVFKVETKSGDIMEYQPIASSNWFTPSWVLTRVTDSVGNYYDISYTGNVETGEHYPYQFKYTGNSAAGLTPYQVITFLYEDRLDDIKAYFNGGKNLVTKRLSRIITGAGEYRISYKPQTATQLSRLWRITRCDNNGKCLPFTEFNWQQAETEGWEPASTSGHVMPEIVNDQNKDQMLRFVDVTGDGLVDVLRSNSSTTSSSGGSSTLVWSEAYINNGIAWMSEPSGSSLIPPAVMSTQDDKDRGVRMIDLNGDGLIDMLYGLGGQPRRAWLNNSAGWVTHSGFVPPVDIVTSNYADNGVYFADIDGDGLTDMIHARGGATRQAWLNTGSGWQLSAYAVPDDFITSDNQDTGVRLIDLNADGLVDFIKARTGAPRSAWLNNGVTWKQDLTYAPPVDIVDENFLDKGVRFIDLNGDGMVDIVYGRNGANGAYLNRGSHPAGTQNVWIADGNYAPLVDIVTTDAKDNGIRFEDVNHDGRVDLLRAYLSRSPIYELQPPGCDPGPGAPGEPVCEQVLVGYNENLVSYAGLNTGSGWHLTTAYQPYALPVPVIDGFEKDQGVRFVDIDGDGITDAIQGKGATAKNWKNKAKNLLVTGIKNGLGANITLNYKPLTAKTNSIYTAGSSQAAAPQHINLQTPMQLVAQVQTDNGIGGTASSSYHYKGLLLNTKGRGSAGFEQVTITDNQTGIITRTDYHQIFPYTGFPKETRQCLTHCEYSNKWLSRTLNNYAQTTTVGNAVFVYPTQTTEETYQLNSANNPNQITSLASIATTNYNSYDNYGNALDISVITINDTALQRFKTSTINVYANTITSSKWHLGRLTQSTVTQYLHNGSTYITDAKSTRISAFEYDPNTGLLVKEIIEPQRAEPEKRVTAYTYDLFGNRNKQTLCATDYNNCGISGQTGPAHLPFRITQTQYDSKGRYPEWITDALGHQETRSYDPSTGNMLSQTGPNQLTTHWFYDGFGRKIREQRADGTETAISLLSCTSGGCPTHGTASHYTVTTTTASAPVYEYVDILNRKLREKHLGFNGSTIYSDTHYDSKGRVEKVSEPYFFYDTPVYSRNEYDAVGRVIKLIPADGSPDIITEYEGLITRGKRTLNGILRSSSETKNVRQQTVSATDTNGKTLLYTYDSQGNTTATQISGQPNTKIEIQYDIHGRKLNMTDPDMGYWNYQYNAYGELISQTDAKNQTITMKYDALGRMSERNEPEGTTTWTYGNTFDPNNRNIGKLIHTSGPGANYHSQTFTYDNLGRPKNTTTQITIAPYLANATFTLGNSYDAATGRLDTMTYPKTNPSDPNETAFAIKHRYNQYGYLEKIQTPNGATVYWQNTGMNARGQITDITHGNGTASAYSYNNSNGLLEGHLTTTGSGGLIQHHSYTHDDAANIKTRTDQRISLTEHFEYDNLDRLTHSWITGGAGSNDRYVTYDTNGLGNIASKTGVGNYTYGNCNAGLHAVCTAGSNSYSYDANGNLLSGAGRNILYTSFNKPYQIQQGGNTVNFYYGAERDRIFKTEASLKTVYIGLGANGGVRYEREENTANTTTRHHYFIYAAGSEVAAVHTVQKTNGTTTGSGDVYFHNDHLGSASTLTDQNAVIISRNSYDAWGKERNAENWSDTPASAATTPGHLGYTGHEMLASVGLIHMNGRVYDPTLGRFLSADPNVQFGKDIQSYNRYSYVRNNPLKYTDPSGYFLRKILQTLASSSFGRFLLTVASIAIGAYATLGTFWNGFLAGYVGSGGNVRAALTGGLTAMAFYGVGEAFQNKAVTQFNANHFKKILLHGLVGGLSSEASGGKFKHGFVSAAFTQAFAPGLDKIGNQGQVDIKRVMAAAVIGGTASELTGGKFANGAMTGAFSRLFNDDKHFGNKDGASNQEVRNIAKALQSNLVDNLNTKIDELNALQGNALIVEFGGGDVVEAGTRRDIVLGTLMRARSFAQTADFLGRLNDGATAIAQEAATLGVSKLFKVPSAFQRLGSMLGLQPSMSDHLNAVFTTNVSCQGFTCGYDIRVRETDNIVFSREFRTR